MQQREEHPAQPWSDVALLVRSLADDGRAVVSLQPSDIEDTDAIPLLQQLDALARDEFALDLPDFSPDVALWAARLFCRLCRFVVCRDLSEEQIKSACNVTCPEPGGPETDWSVDLTLRHLPNLFRLARHLSNADPLVGEMKKIAANWPLSSVGIDGLDALKIDSFVDHPGLRRLYADRVGMDEWRRRRDTRGTVWPGRSYVRINTPHAPRRRSDAGSRGSDIFHGR
jgi:MoxR-vWA-beta-propeller ternary system domain bpX4